MSLLIVRPMSASETNLVISSWKNHLFADRKNQGWANGLRPDCFWPLVNHVIDRITMPSCAILVGRYAGELGQPLCWAAVRAIPLSPTSEVLYVDALPRIREDLELAATLERELLSEIHQTVPIFAERRPFNPFFELKR